jgi:hypothetical protein
VDSREYGCVLMLNLCRFRGKVIAIPKLPDQDSENNLITIPG